jgi:hypothetical protein
MLMPEIKVVMSRIEATVLNTVAKMEPIELDPTKFDNPTCTLELLQ